MGPPPQVAKNGPFSQGPIQRIYQRRSRIDFLIFGLVGVDFLHFGLVRLFGLLCLHFSFSASILAFGASILPLWALRRGILWLFVSFWAFRTLSVYSLRPFEPSGGYPSQFRASDRGPPPTSCQKRSVFPRSHTKNLSAPWPSRFSNFWACGR